MQRTSFADFNCSIARTVDIVGEWWTFLILRDAFLGTHRFDDFQRSLGIARNVLTNRLQRLVEAGILERRQYQTHPDRFEYLLTKAGRELFPVVVSLLEWGDRWTAGEAGPPLELVHAPCGHVLGATLVCDKCGKAIVHDDARPRPGPGTIPA